MKLFSSSAYQRPANFCLPPKFCNPLIVWILFSHILSGLFAQPYADERWAVGCAEIEEASLRLECSEKRVLDLAEETSILQKAVVEQHSIFLKKIEEEINGPEKVFIPIPHVEFYEIYIGDINNWGRRSNPTRCGNAQEIDQKDGFTVVGAVVSGEKHLISNHYKPGQYAELYFRMSDTIGSLYRFWQCPMPRPCRSRTPTQRFCSYASRNAGCYVNNEWLEWFKRRAEQLRIPVDAHTVCH